MQDIPLIRGKLSGTIFFLSCFIYLYNYAHLLALIVIATDFFNMLYSYTPLSGFHGVLSGFLVGIKQITPDDELSLVKIKVKVLFGY